MRYLVLILMLFLVLSFVDAARININLKESYEKDGKNITLISIVKDKALVCINNQYGIISKDVSRTINDVNFVLKKTYDNYIRTDVKVYCENCKCDDSCNNIECLNINQKQIKEEIKKEEAAATFSEYQNTEIIENKGLSKGGIIGAVLFLLILGIVVYFLIKRT